MISDSNALNAAEDRRALQSIKMSLLWGKSGSLFPHLPFFGAIRWQHPSGPSGQTCGTLYNISIVAAARFDFCMRIGSGWCGKRACREQCNQKYTAITLANGFFWQELRVLIQLEHLLSFAAPRHGTNSAETQQSEC